MTTFNPTASQTSNKPNLVTEILVALFNGVPERCLKKEDVELVDEAVGTEWRTVVNLYVRGVQAMMGREV